MQLPFIVTIVPPTRAGFRHVVRSPVAWPVAVFLLLLACASVLTVREIEHSKPPTPSGHLILVGVPPDITVAVDGQSVPLTSSDLSLVVGNHIVTFRGTRIIDASDRVVVRVGETTTMAPDLWLRHPPPAQLRPTYPGAAIVGASFLNDGRVALIESLPRTRTINSGWSILAVHPNSSDQQGSIERSLSHQMVRLSRMWFKGNPKRADELPRTRCGSRMPLESTCIWRSPCHRKMRERI